MADELPLRTVKYFFQLDQSYKMSIFHVLKQKVNVESNTYVRRLVHVCSNQVEIDHDRRPPTVKKNAIYVCGGFTEWHLRLTSC